MSFRILAMLAATALVTAEGQTPRPARAPDRVRASSSERTSSGAAPALSQGTTGADDCQDAVVHAVTVPEFSICEDTAQPCASDLDCGGSSCGRRRVVQLTGDNSSASGPDCIDLDPDPLWWEAFQVDDCAYVRIDFCGTSPPLDPFYTRLYEDCPCGAPVDAQWNPHDIDTSPGTDFGTGAPFCGDNNPWMFFGPLGPGTYYYPIYSQPNGHLGPYQLQLTVDACPEAACCVGGACHDFRNIQECEALGGMYLGPPNKHPAAVVCVPPDSGGTCDPFDGTFCGTCQLGSCCEPEIGTITGPGSCDDLGGGGTQMTEPQCQDQLGNYIGGIRCKGGYCGVTTVSCSSNADCASLPGSPPCNGSALQLAQPSPCPPAPEGACCMSDGTCTVGPESACTDGTYLGDDIDCTACPDVPQGGCCRNNGTCFIGPESSCIDGTYLGDETDCSAPCPCACNADVTDPFFPSAGQPNFADIAYIIDCYKGVRTDPACDVDCDGEVTGADIGVAVCQFKAGFSDPTCCEGPTGACCDTSAAPCLLTRNAADCESPFGGTYLGDGTDCDLGPCDCNDNGIDDKCDTTCAGLCNVPGCGNSSDCNDNSDPDECENPDPNTIGACCLIVNNVPGCDEITEQNCDDAGGMWRPCTKCPAQNVMVVPEPGGEIFIHVIGPPVDCDAGSNGAITRRSSAGGPFFDAWQSPADGSMCHTFGVAGSPALPADFFGSGSDAFTGSVCLEGVDLGFPEFPGADTIIERDADPFDRCSPPVEPPVMVPIQIVALSLRSVAPITVSFNGGASTETWDVFVDLSEVESPSGSLTVFKTHCNGGVFTSVLPVQPRFTFVNTDTPTETAELDTGLAGDDPIVLSQPTPLPWVSRLASGLPIVVDPHTSFHPAVDEVYATDDCDCNDNGVHDACETGGGASGDCNFNGTLDECDITAGLLADADENGQPDACEAAGPSQLVPCPNVFADATTPPTGGLGGDRLSRFLCVSSPAPPAAAGGAGTAIRVRLKTMYNTTPGDPDGANVCPSVGRTQPSLSQFNDQVRWAGTPDAAADDAVPAPPDYVVAPLRCEPALEQWDENSLESQFGNADGSRIYLYGAEVVPCSVYEVSVCNNPEDEESCGEPVVLRTARLGDCWPAFAPAIGQPSFSDIGATVAKFKSLPFSPGASPTGGPPEWHALIRGNIVADYHISLVRKVDFIDIGKIVESFKSIAYKEDGPCNPTTGVDNCGDPCTTAP